MRITWYHDITCPSPPPPSLSSPTTYRERWLTLEPVDSLPGDRSSFWPDCVIFCSCAASSLATLEGWISPGSKPPAWRPDIGRRIAGCIGRRKLRRLCFAFMWFHKRFSVLKSLGHWLHMMKSMLWIWPLISTFFWISWHSISSGKSSVPPASICSSESSKGVGEGGSSNSSLCSAVNWFLSASPSQSSSSSSWPTWWSAIMRRNESKYTLLLCRAMETRSCWPPSWLLSNFPVNSPFNAAKKVTCIPIQACLDWNHCTPPNPR